MFSTNNEILDASFHILHTLCAFGLIKINQIREEILSAGHFFTSSLLGGPIREVSSKGPQNIKNFKIVLQSQQKSHIFQNGLSGSNGVQEDQSHSKKGLGNLTLKQMLLGSYMALKVSQILSNSQK